MNKPKNGDALVNLLVQSFPSAVRETLNVAHRELSREFKNDLCLLAEGGVTGQEGRSEGHTDGEREMQDPGIWFLQRVFLRMDPFEKDRREHTKQQPMPYFGCVR